MSAQGEEAGAKGPAGIETDVAMIRNISRMCANFFFVKCGDQESGVGGRAVVVSSPEMVTKCCRNLCRFHFDDDRYYR